VIFERLVFTAGMVVIYYVMRTIWQDLPVKHVAAAAETETAAMTV
jgi:hypothetical protein